MEPCLEYVYIYIMEQNSVFQRKYGIIFREYKITSDDRRCSSHLKNPFYRGSIKGDGKSALCQWCLSCFGPSLLSMVHVGTVWPDVSAQSGSTLFVPVYVFIVC